jgi:fructose-1,6-bisphosphatase/inositol monophosphatase family enzyme
MTGVDWLEVCRDAAVGVRRVLDELPTRVEREPRVGDGRGGDETTAIDAAAEAAVVERLEGVPAGFTLVSEELGERVFGDGGNGLTVICDPIDGA